MKALVFHSAITLRAVESSVTRAAEDWLQNWSLLPAAIVSVQAVRAKDGFETNELAASFRHSNAGLLALTSDNTVWHQLLFPSDAPMDDVALALLERALADFSARVFSALGWQWSSPQSTHFDNETFVSGVHCTITVGNLRLTLLVAVEALKAMPKPKATSLEPLLHKRAEAVTAAKARARVTLDLGSLPLTQLQQLAVGDTLVSDSPLHTPFRVELTDAVAMHAHLGRQQQVKAVYLVKK